MTTKYYSWQTFLSLKVHLILRKVNVAFICLGEWIRPIDTNLSLSALMQSGQGYQCLFSKQMFQFSRSSHQHKYEDYLILESTALANLPEMLFCVLFLLFDSVEY